ncbi:hypothetical protein [Paenarthrobacter sp. AB444]|uniref:hypothetical protein n=1 Tax=Paenarthrobacter sp. AB444 TaxID=3025681 RepID=UPI00236608CA|nr:hypothetical protein [Paenarthrobacter sp. AB444]MDD7833940.1 hypothetical protein [Paenarthrobacter sp. AB444]
MSSKSSIDWRTIPEVDFNSLAEALIVRDRTREGFVGQAIDGRGGDGGIDIDVREAESGDLLEIIQLKWFREGFSSNFRKRRDQIRRSFESAMALNPPRWTLVVPANLTVPERQFVSAMRRGRPVSVRFIGATELNLLLADYPEVHDWATRDVAMSALALIQRESAALRRPGDLAAETSKLASRADGTSAYWGRGVAFQSGVYVETLYAKKPDACEREPLSIVLSTVFGPDDSELRAKYEDTLAYGPIEPLTLPSTVVEAFSMVGPEWFAQEHGAGEFHIRPGKSSVIDDDLKLVSKNKAGRALATLRGRAVTSVTGATGAALECHFPGGLRQVWRFPEDLMQPALVTMRCEPEGYSAHDVKRAFSFLNSLASAETVEMNVNGHARSLSCPEFTSNSAPSSGVHELIDDLAYLESQLNIEFEFPKLLPRGHERVWIRVVRRMLEGRSVAVPNRKKLEVTLDGGLDNGTKALLSERGSHMIYTESDWCVTLLGEKIILEDMRIYHPRLIADGAQQHLQAVKNGLGAGRRVTLRPANGEPFVIFSPSRMRPNDAIVAEPWGIEGILEPAGLALLGSTPAEIADVGS